MPFNVNEFLPLLAVLLAFAGGAAIACLLMRSRLRDANAGGRTSRDGEVAQLTTERDTSQEALQRLHRDHDATLRELAEHRARVVALSREGATLAGRLERLPQVEGELAAARGDEALNEACQRRAAPHRNRHAPAGTGPGGRGPGDA
jgi:hypothetical protein